MKTKTIAAVTASLILISGPATLAQDNSDVPGAKAEQLPSLATYPDMGEEFDMIWSGYGDDANAYVDFATPETDNRLWSIRCVRRAGNARIRHQIEGVAKDMGAGDRFGFTIRVDDKPSLGMIARMELTDGDGGPYYVPRFYTSNRHSLYEDLAKGNRAYINLNGSKFSVHLKGSGKALIEFLKACR